MYRVISFITIILISSLTHAENGEPVKIPTEIQEKTEVIGSSLGSINGEQYQVNLIRKSSGSTGIDIAISVYKLEG